MLIVSKFHDYYDTAIAFGIDKTIVYERSREETKHKSSLRTRRRFWFYDKVETKGHEYDYNQYVIGFCGNLYPCVEIVKKSKDWRDNYKEESKFFYDTEEMVDYLVSENVPEKKRYGKWWPYSKQDTQEFFSHDKWSKYKSYFMNHKVPVFMLTEDKLILNPQLKDHRFAKIKDPFSAFQDIMQYISGVLGVGEPNTVEISNEDMRDKKGFDNWSFKKHPDDSKKPRRRGK